MVNTICGTHAVQWYSHWGGKGGRVPPLTAKKWPKTGKKRENQEKSGKNQEKSGRKDKNREVSLTLPLLTDRAGYATDAVLYSSFLRLNCSLTLNCIRGGVPWYPTFGFSALAF